MDVGWICDRHRLVSMSLNVLLAWEMGAGLSHATRLLVVAKALKALGWTPIVAARDVSTLVDRYRVDNISVVQAPVHKSQAPPGEVFRARSFADIVASCGFQRLEALWPVVVAWDSLLDLIRPAAVVADYCPILPLACLGRVAVVTIGDGFVVPPGHLPKMPPLQSTGTKMASEEVSLAHACEVQRRRGISSLPSSLPSLIAGDASVVCTFPELDVYGRDRQVPATGPLASQITPVSPPAKASLFAYLAADFPKTRKLLQAILDSGIPAAAYVRDASDDLKHALRARGLTIHDEPPPPERAFAEATLIIHHGGIGTIEACLMLGRPQLLLTRHLEQSLNGSLTRSLGVADTLRSGFTLAHAAAQIREMCCSAEWADRAGELALSIQQRKRGHSLELIEQSIRRLAAQ
jgi:rhamnosyltransferase subunit B